jgi:signal transduction histidine kinase
MSRAPLILIFSFICFLKVSGQTTEKQLRDSLANEQNDKTKMKLLLKLARKVTKRSADSAMQLALRAMSIAKSSESEKDIARAYRAVGHIFYDQGKYSSAIENYKTAFIHSQKVHDSLLLSTELDEIGRSYRRIGEPKQALEFLQQGLDIATAFKDKDMIAGIYNNMAMVLNDTGDDSLALKYYQKSLSMAEDAKDTSSIILCLNNIGFQYSHLKDRKKEEEHYLKALELLDKTKNTEMYGITYDNIGSMWEDRGNLQKAFVYFQKSLEYERKSGVKAYVIEELKSIVGVCIKLKNYEMALQYAKEEFKLSEEVQSPELKASSAKSLSIVYEKLKQFEQSLNYLKISNILHDSINSLEKAKTVANLASRYELTKKESEIKSLNLEKEMQKTELLLQSKIRYGLIIFLLAVSTLLIVAIYQYRARKKANDMLVVWSQAVDQKNQQLDNLNKVKDKIFSSIAHDVRSPLSSIQGLLSLMNLNVLSPDELQKIIVELSARVNTTTSLLENLLNWSRNQIATAKANPIKTNVKDLANECIELYHNNAVEKNITLVNKIPDSSVIYADEEMIRIILRNLISNAIKFTRLNGEVKVEAIPQENILCISVSDTGVGIPQANLEKIFSFDTKSTQGTAQEKGTGLGLVLCKEFIEKNGGKIWVDSLQGEGSTFSFTVPIA